MLKYLLMIIMFTVSATSSAAALDRPALLECTSDLATGFHNQGDGYTETRFRGTLEIFSFWPNFTSATRDTNVRMSCSTKRSATFSEVLMCVDDPNNSSDRLVTLILDRQNMRFVMTSISINGYLDRRSRDTDVIYAGTCEIVY